MTNFNRTKKLLNIDEYYYIIEYHIEQLTQWLDIDSPYDIATEFEGIMHQRFAEINNLDVI